MSDPSGLRAATAVVYVEDLSSGPVVGLSDEDAHHLGHVRRVRDGEVVIASDGRGSWQPCRAVGRGASFAVVVDGPVSTMAASSPRITVGFSWAKGERSEWAVAKLAELGVDRIVPLVCERTVVRPGEGRRSERLLRIVRESCAQSRRVWLPDVCEPLPFRDFLGAETGSGAEGGTGSGVALAEPGGAGADLHRPTVLVGPEGGWSPAELDTASDAGAGLVGLGDGVLRVETAAVAAGAILAALRSGTVISRT